MLPGKFLPSFFSSFCGMCFVSWSPPYATPSLPLQFLSLSCPKVHPPPPFFTHSTFSLLRPSWVPPLPPLTLLTTLCLHTPAAISIHTRWLAFYARNLLHFTPRLQYFHSQITQKCSVIVPVSAIPLPRSLTPAFSGPVWVTRGERILHCERISGAIHSWCNLTSASKFLSCAIIVHLRWHTPLRFDGHHQMVAILKAPFLPRMKVVQQIHQWLRQAHKSMFLSLIEIISLI